MTLLKTAATGILLVLLASLAVAWLAAFMFCNTGARRRHKNAA